MGILDRPRKLTYDDYLRIPEDGLRHEIVDGVEVVTPSPTWDHQDLQGGVFRQLDEQIRDRGRGWVVTAPMDVRLSETDIVQPDVLAVSTRNIGRIAAQVLLGPPDLVVEILSRSTASRDRGIKRLAYDRTGVPELWFIDPRIRSAERWSRKEKGPLQLDGSFASRLASRSFPGVVIDLEKLWRRLEA